jgi:transposase
LRQENAQLKNRIRELEHKKRSHNSSVPPSQDENRVRKTRSLREKSKRKPGGQQGHEGSSLKMYEQVDHIIDHVPDYCKECGKPLIKDQKIQVGRRQEVDIPPIKPVVTEHRLYEVKCSCGHCTRSDYPQGVRAPISYGSHIEGLVSYFNVRQYLPLERMQEMFSEVFGVPLSQGSICNKIATSAKKGEGMYNQIGQKLQQSKQAVGSDETGFVLNGKKHWMWTWQNKSMTYIAPSKNRGYKTVEDHFSNGFSRAVLVHDCWRTHFKTPALDHQICIAHLLRELMYFIEEKKSKWAYSFRQLLRKALKVKQKMIYDFEASINQQVDQIKKQLLSLLNLDLDTECKKLKSFKKRMIKYHCYLLTFLDYKDVPPDNNASERAIRNVKVKQKISGQFKNMENAKHFAIIRSIIDTCIKNNKPVIPALMSLCDYYPE